MKKSLLRISAVLTMMTTSVGFSQYCTVVGPSDPDDTNVEAVVLNGETMDINFTGSCPGVTGLEDQTGMVADVLGGNSYILEVTWGTCGGSWGNAGEIWIDFDGDEVFEASESIGTVDYGGGTNVQTYGFTVPTSAVVGTHRMRVMQHEGGSLPLDPCATYTWGSVVDFTIDITGIVTCPSPSGITLDFVTTDSAGISWTAGGSEVEWQIDYGVPGMVPGTESPSFTTDLTDTLSGLMSNTNYEFYVRGICGAGDTSSWTGPFTFTTNCGILTAIEYCEDFEPSSTTQNCWTVLDENSDGDLWNMDDASQPHTGTQAAMINTDFNSGSNDDWLISPQLTVTGNEMMTFWYSVYDSFEPNDFEVLLSTTGNDPADFTETLMALDSYDNETYMDTTVDLTSYSGEVYIAFHIPSGGLDGWRLYIDDICFNVCDPTPGVDGATDVCRTDGTVNLNPVITTAETSGYWTFDLNPALVSDSTFNITTLPEGTFEVDYIVEGGCSSDTTTAEITIYDAPNAGDDGAFTVCQNEPFSLFAGLSGSVDFGGQWLDESMTSVSGMTMSLSTTGDHSFYYIASNGGVCPDDTAEIVVTVDGNCDYLTMDESKMANLSIYPNPTNGMINISNSGSDEALNLEIRDISGRVIESHLNKVTGTIVTQMDLSSYEKGMYFIRVFNDEAERTVKVILK